MNHTKQYMYGNFVLSQSRKGIFQMRVIYVPSIERSIPLGAYIAAVKRAKANPDAMFKQGITTWWSTSGRDIMAQFFNGMQDRINQAIPYTKRGF